MFEVQSDHYRDEFRELLTEARNGFLLQGDFGNAWRIGRVLRRRGLFDQLVDKTFDKAVTDAATSDIEFTSQGQFLDWFLDWLKDGGMDLIIEIIKELL